MNTKYDYDVVIVSPDDPENLDVLIFEDTKDAKEFFLARRDIGQDVILSAAEFIKRKND